MKSADDLRQLLQNIDRKSYPAYKGTKGVYRFGKYALGIDHVQGDPFAARPVFILKFQEKWLHFQSVYTMKHGNGSHLRII